MNATKSCFSSAVSFVPSIRLKNSTVPSRMAIGDGPNKPFALRGVKDNPPYLHDERLLTLEDTAARDFSF
jgi:hypothetical protein